MMIMMNLPTKEQLSELIASDTTGGVISVVFRQRYPRYANLRTKTPSYGAYVALVVRAPTPDAANARLADAQNGGGEDVCEDVQDEKTFVALVGRSDGAKFKHCADWRRWLSPPHQQQQQQQPAAAWHTLAGEADAVDLLALLPSNVRFGGALLIAEDGRLLFGDKNVHEQALLEPRPWPSSMTPPEEAEDDAGTSIC